MFIFNFCNPTPEAKLGPLPVSSPSLPEDSTGCGSGLPEPISIASDQITQSDEEFDIPLARLSDKYAGITLLFPI